MPTTLPNATRFQYSPFLVTVTLVAAHSVRDLRTPSTSEVLPVVEELAPGWRFYWVVVGPTVRPNASAMSGAAAAFLKGEPPFVCE